ncbi:MAG: aromatic ring-hydroxylating dioxygenase subunit alpha [Gemmatimonadota bacterium]|nr:aromatic ring-hydroxylating dioxygenase subunit alpha [Gemmatimonadota bacterium]
MDRPVVDPDIRRAWTTPSATYGDPAAFERQRERVFARSWQWVADADRVKAPGHVLPFTLLEGCLDEPLVLACGEDGRTRCLSNVCTHRGALVVEGEGHVHALRCRYHGRKFGLDGRFASMPEFEGAEGFPCASDDLPALPLERFGPLWFSALDPAVSFAEWIEPVRARTAFLPWERAVFDASTAREYYLDAHWALYVDNYLEEFHIPYVHGGSLQGLDYGAYHTECFDHGNLQIGVGREGEPALDLPADHPNAGTRVAALYFWLFPSTMLNVYPWGLSLNVIEPLGPSRTRVRFRPYVWDASRRAGVGGDLHRVEMEDEEIVESVQRGVRSRLYDRGRFSPRREVGTHHFHVLLERALG